MNVITEASGTEIVRGTFQLDDYWRANRYLQNRMPRVWFARGFLILMPWVIILARYRSNPEDFTWWLLLVPAGLLFAVLVVLPMTDRRSVARRMRSIPGAFAERSYVFSDDGVEIGGVNENVDLRWPALIKATESSSDFFLFVGSNVAQFVPKRFLSGIDQQTRLREIIKRNLGSKARL